MGKKYPIQYVWKTKTPPILPWKFRFWLWLRELLGGRYLRHLINSVFRVLMVLWVTYLPFYKVYIDYLHSGESVSLGVTFFGVVLLSVAFMILICIYWKRSNVPILCYLGFSTWILSRQSIIISVGKILFNVPLLLGGIFIVLAIVGLKQYRISN